MAYTDQPQTADLRTNLYDKMVKGFAMQKYKFKQAVSVVSTSAWKNYFYRENPTQLTAYKGIPRGADFPQADVTYERVSAVIEKYGLESNIAYEDILTDDIDVRDRTLMRVAEGVAKAVDDEIYDKLSESGTPTNIQSVTIEAGYEWDTSSGAIFDNLGEARQKIAEYNYETTDLLCFISPKDQRSITSYIFSKGAQAPQLSDSTARNGSIGKLNGVDFIVSNSVEASQALLVVPKVCGTWKEVVPLQTTTKEDPYKSVTIRSVELGTTQVTDPKAVVLILNTQSAS